MFYLGIDLGASSVKLVALREGEVLRAERRVHEGSPVDCLKGMLGDLALPSKTGVFAASDNDAGKSIAGGNAAGTTDGNLDFSKFGCALDLRECAGVAVCGSGADLFSACGQAMPGVRIAELEDIPALTGGVAALAPQARSIISMGAQSAAFITGFSDGAVPQFSMNENCAAGTGSFFEDQMGRLGLQLNDYSELVSRARSVPRLSGRCSVFAKTDIIHRQQEGVPVEDILQGLCHATVKAFKATIVRSLPVEAPVALVGGTLLNAGVVRAVREVFNLGEGELIADEQLLFAQALGAALRAEELGTGSDVAAKAVASAQAEVHAGAGEGARPSAAIALQRALGRGAASDDLPRLDPLPQVDCAPKQGYSLVEAAWNEAAPVPVALGIDVGSTSTNLVLLGLDGSLHDAQYLRTRGNPKQAVRDGLASLGKRIGAGAQVVAVGVTGSGRSMIGELVGADAVRDEITAQARGAAAADPQVDTVFEIGGQDSKYISLSEGRVIDFQMNKVCAAGTGSFVEEQAGRLGINLPEYGPIALSATAPIDLGERCTVFVETAIHTALAKGASKADVAAGLCLSVVRNYLHKVVGTKPVGKRIVLQGGVAYNPAIEAAFRAFAGDALTVSPWFAVSGAVGAALLALEAQGVSVPGAGAQSEVAGQGSSANCEDVPAVSESTETPAELPASAFKGWNLEGAALQAKHVDPAEIAANRAFFHKVDELYEEGYTPEANDPDKLTVGVPRALMMHKLFPMANAFFKALGFNVLLSDVSDEETVRRAQQCAQGETCYPVKLVHGHMAQLADAGVDYIFMPNVHTIRHAKSTVDHNYACAYMQTIPQIVAQELHFEERGIKLLSPTFDMDFGQSAMATALLSVGAELGKTPQESARAMLAGGFAVSEFTRKTEALGDELLANLKPGERVFVIVTRNYGIVDPALNMGIPDMLLDRGCKVITVSHLHAHDLSIELDYPDMYWPFGQHMLSGAKLIRRDPRMFMIYLTNHGCGPDTMVSHLIRREMGDKPFLQIEMDEHFSKVGVETRVEAFLSAIERYEARELRDVPTSTEVVNVRCLPLAASPARVVMPSFGPYGELCAGWLRGRGFNVEAVSPNFDALELGRCETTSKEYLSFTATLGVVLQAAMGKGAAREGAGADAAGAGAGVGAGDAPVIPADQVIVAGSQGGEADGQYARAMQSILDEKGLATRVVAPSLELLPCTMENIDELFVRLLAGDVVNAAPVAAREAVFGRLCQREAASGLTLNAVVEIAAQVAAAKAAQPVDGDAKTLALVGEWPLAVADDLCDGAWAALEGEGYSVVRMPFAEYLWFLWCDAYREAEHEKVVGEVIPLLGEGAGPVTVGLPDDREQLVHDHAHNHAAGHVHGVDCASCSACGVGSQAGEGSACAVSSEVLAAKLRVEMAERALREDPLCGMHERKLPRDQWQEVLQRLAAMMDAVAEALGAASPYSANRDHLEQFATQGMRLYAGAGGRYRFAKAQQVSETADGVIVVASLYENTDTAIRLKGIPAKAPLLHLAFDGALDKNIEERLRSFLYYL